MDRVKVKPDFIKRPENEMVIGHSADDACKMAYQKALQAEQDRRKKMGKMGMMKGV